MPAAESLSVNRDKWVKTAAFTLRNALEAVLPFPDQIREWKFSWNGSHGHIAVDFVWRGQDFYCQLKPDAFQDTTFSGGAEGNDAAALLLQEMVREHFLAMERSMLNVA